MTPSLHLWLIPILPLIGAAINGFFGRRLSRQTVSAVALTFCGAALSAASNFGINRLLIGPASRGDTR